MFIKTTDGFSKQNKDLSIVSDWIESSTVLLNEEVSISDVVDVLTEENLFYDQNDAVEFVSNCWVEIRRRHKNFGDNTLVEIKNQRLICHRNWKDLPGYSFCLAISLASYYHKPNYISRSYQEIGKLFEILSKEALSYLFPNWKLYHTGWSIDTETDFTDLLKSIETEFSLKRQLNWADYFTSREKDATLDIILSRPFLDKNNSYPFFLIQCAGGQNWTLKRKEPNVSVWNKFINFDSPLTRGLIIPFSLTQMEFRHNAPHVEGILFDRYRILAPYQLELNWVSNSLKGELNKVTEDIVGKIEQY